MRLMPYLQGVLVVIVAVTGCSGTGDGASGTPGANVQDAATNYAQAIRGSALSVRDGLREESGLLTAQGNTESLLEALEGYESNADAKPHLATYDEITNIAKELMGLFDAKSQPAQIRDKIAQLAAAAEKLPGTAEAPSAANVDR